MEFLEVTWNGRGYTLVYHCVVWFKPRWDVGDVGVLGVIEKTTGALRIRYPNSQHTGPGCH